VFLPCCNCRVEMQEEMEAKDAKDAEERPLGDATVSRSVLDIRSFRIRPIRIGRLGRDHIASPAQTTSMVIRNGTGGGVNIKGLWRFGW